ncbi:hypothetical protein [Kiloniella laminariae]|uniref:hypothetical protein n=1 Tax=Kiloniella laminariae TaxID=454162 RepID=UPI00036471F1|nr:hypothetical protein [Kiloniella laminariae]
MLREAFEYFFTDCRKDFKRLGYLHEAIAIEARYRRCHKSWHEHLSKTKLEIRKAVEATDGRERVVVLGAGAAHDIPLEYLLKEFTQVVLVDVVFLKPLRKLAQKTSNLNLVEEDVTGLANRITPLKPGVKRDQFPLPRPPEELLIPTDLVISCNLLSQLPIQIRNHLVGGIENQENPTLDSYCRKIIVSHLDWIQRFNSSLLLVTDLERLLSPVNRQEGPVIRDNALYGVELISQGEQWIWDIAPRPEIDPKYDLKHLVGSFFFARGQSIGFSQGE